MCTVSWKRRVGGYDLLFNRDEQRSRPLALPPKEMITPDGVHYLAPLDPQGGGSWIFLNEFGVCAALLNQYGTGAQFSAATARSRGQLLMELATVLDVRSLLLTATERVRTARHNPFLILAIDVEGGLGLFSWNGTQVSYPSPPEIPVVTTSSIRLAEVSKFRKHRYKEIMGDGNTLRSLRAFHMDHLPDKPAVSVLMSRPDARTVSITRVSVNSSSAEMEYLPVLETNPPKPGRGNQLSLPVHQPARNPGIRLCRVEGS